MEFGGLYGNGGLMFVADCQTTSVTANSQSVWVNWQPCTQTVGNVTYQNVVWGQWNQDSFGQVTAEQMAQGQAQLQQQAELQRQAVREAAQRHEAAMKAEQKAEALLFLYLTDEQRKQYQRCGYFETKVNDTVYRIRKGIAGNITEYKDGKAVNRLCVHCNSSMPESDHVLAQLLALHADEKALRNRANHTPLV